MRRWILAGAVLLVAATLKAEVPTVSSATLSPADRLMVIAPHPDDETIGAGGVIQAALAMKIPVRVVFLTYGDNNEWSFSVYRRRPVTEPAAIRSMGEVRHDEAIAACRILGLKETDLVFLGYPDFGLLTMFTSVWGPVKPFESARTKASAVPYGNAFRPGAAYRGEELLADLETQLKQFRPTKVIVPHAADEMPDHRAGYLFVRVALWDLASQVKAEIWPYLVHFRFRSWPQPEGYLPQSPLSPPAFFEGSVNWRQFPLSKEFVARKYEALQAHRTQFGYSGRYLSSFVRANELFGDLYPFDASELEGHPASDVRREPEPVRPELTSQEQALFVGLEQRTIYLEGTDIVEKITFTREPSRDVTVAVYFEGYRRDVPFAQMPKVRVVVARARRHQVLDQQNAGVTVTRKEREVTIRCPLRGLGYPEKVMTSARSYLAEVPLDWMSWRVIENLPPEPSEPR